MLADHSKDSAESAWSAEYMRTRWTRKEQKVNICAKRMRENCSEHIKTRKESNRNDEKARNSKMTRTQSNCVGKRYDAHLETKWAKKLKRKSV